MNRDRPRDRLIQTYNWLNFKACMAVGTWGLVVLIVLVVWVREAR